MKKAVIAVLVILGLVGAGYYFAGSGGNFQGFIGKDVTSKVEVKETAGKETQKQTSKKSDKSDTSAKDTKAIQRALEEVELSPAKVDRRYTVSSPNVQRSHSNTFGQFEVCTVASQNAIVSIDQFLVRLYSYTENTLLQGAHVELYSVTKGETVDTLGNSPTSVVVNLREAMGEYYVESDPEEMVTIDIRPENLSVSNGCETFEVRANQYVIVSNQSDRDELTQTTLIHVNSNGDYQGEPILDNWIDIGYNNY